MAEYTPVPHPRSPAEMEALSQDDAILLSAQGQEEGARTMLVEALCILGRFKEALKIETDPDRQGRIQVLIKAEAAADGTRCKCENTVDTADYARNPKAEPRLLPTANYVRSFRHWSAKYGRMVWNYTCVLCKHSNTLPDDVAVWDTKLRK